MISGSSQNVLIDSSGIRIRSLEGSTYDPKQIWMNNGIIAFTQDNWDTASLALVPRERPLDRRYLSFVPPAFAHDPG